MADPQDGSITCEGDGHVWETLPSAPGEEWWAVARCCGRKAVQRHGEWVLVDPAEETRPEA